MQDLERAGGYYAHMLRTVHFATQLVIVGIVGFIHAFVASLVPFVAEEVGAEVCVLARPGGPSDEALRRAGQAQAQAGNRRLKLASQLPAPAGGVPSRAGVAPAARVEQRPAARTVPLCARFRWRSCYES